MLYMSSERPKFDSQRDPKLTYVGAKSTITGKKYHIISRFLLLKKIMSFRVNKYLILVVDLKHYL